MKGEFREALETLRHELKEELKYLVGRRVLFEKPDDIVRNDWQFFQEFFEKFIQREKNRIFFKIREVQKLGDIERKLRDIEQELRDIKKSLEEIKKKRRELGEELDGLKEYLRIILRKGAVLDILEEYLEGVKRDVIFYCNLDPRDLVNVGLISEDIWRLIEPYYVKYEHIIEEKRRLEDKEEELKEQKRILLRWKEDLPLELKKLKIIELIEAQRDMNKIQEFIKDSIKEIRLERVNEEEIPDHYIFGDDDVLS